MVGIISVPVMFLSTLVIFCMYFLPAVQGISLQPIHAYVDNPMSLNANLSCRVSGDFDPQRNYTIEWYKTNQGDLRNNSAYSTFQNGTDSVLVVKAVDPDTVGMYTCRVVDPVSLLWETASPRLEAGPFVKIIRASGEKSLTRVAGEDINLMCSVWGWPAVKEIKWMRVHEEEGYANLTAYQNVTTDPDNSAMVNATVYLTELMLDDRGNYECVAIGNLNNGTQVLGGDTVLLRVKDPMSPLWPFIGILAEVVLLAVIIVAYEVNKKRKQKKKENRDSTEQRLITSNAGAGHNDDDGKDLRQRK